MTASGKLIDYQDRLDRVTAYIHDHLDEELDFQKLAEVACLSPYHWHRIYQAVHGESAAATVKRLRLHRAAGQLANTELPVRDIAEASGYKSLQSFTRAFRSVFGLPPAQYRARGSHTQFQPRKQEGAAAMYDVSLKTIPRTTAITIRHSGPYMQIGKTFETLFGWLATRGLLNDDLRTVGIYYDDPDAVPEAELRSRAGVITASEFSIEAPLEHTEMAGGPYAVLRHKGPYADMPAAYRWLFAEWLVKSGREPAHAPCFEEYLNDPRETPPTELLTDIFLPLTQA